MKTEHFFAPLCTFAALLAGAPAKLAAAKESAVETSSFSVALHGAVDPRWENFCSTNDVTKKICLLEKNCIIFNEKLSIRPSFIYQSL